MGSQANTNDKLQPTCTHALLLLLLLLPEHSPEAHDHALVLALLQEVNRLGMANQLRPQYRQYNALCASMSQGRCRPVLRS